MSKSINKKVDSAIETSKNRTNARYGQIYQQENVDSAVETSENRTIKVFSHRKFPVILGKIIFYIPFIALIVV